MNYLKFFSFIILFFVASFQKINAQQCNPLAGKTFFVTSEFSLSQVINQINQENLPANIMFNVPNGILNFDGGIMISTNIQPQVNIQGKNIPTNKPIIINGGNLLAPPFFILGNSNSCMSDIEYVNFRQGTYWVTNNNDSGPGSLRQFIQVSNEFGGGVIGFNIPGTPPHKITFLTELPPITKTIIIDGSSQPSNGYSGSALKIELDGSGLSGKSCGLKLLAANDCSINGLYIHGFDTGIRAERTNYTTNQSKYGGTNLKIGNTGMSGNVIGGNTSYGIYLLDIKGASIQNNKIGTDATGKLSIPNGDGIYTVNDTNTVVNNNLVSGNSSTGISCIRSINVRITSNYIGTDLSGLLPLSNYKSGIYFVGVDGATIGGTDPFAKGNLISGNNSSQSGLEGGLRLDVLKGKIRIIGNKIGTDANGTNAIPNYYGVVVLGGSRVFIGSSTYGESNLISGNTKYGIYTRQISDTLSIKGNFIGTNYSGSAALPNTEYGIFFHQEARCFIGGTLPGERNVISGNGSSGIFIDIKETNHIETIISQNIIGLNASGSAAIPNASGISSHNSSGDYKIIGNTISGNKSSGLSISGSNAIIRNNKIGTDATGTKNFGNGTDGISMFVCSSAIIGGSEADANTIAFNGDNGIEMNNISISPTRFNLISQNKIFNNTNRGISHGNSPDGPANDGYKKPIITWASPSMIEGTAPANSLVELYYNHTSNSFTQGQTFITTISADGKGYWKYEKPLTNPFNLTALSVDATNKNTSEFSDLYNYTEWTGATGSAFNKPENWSNGVPSSEIHAIIPVTKTNPVVSITDNNAVSDLYIAPSARLFMEGGKLTISNGNFENNGESDLGYGTVVFAGVSAQKIYGYNNFGSLSIENKGKGIYFHGNQTVKNHLQLTNGVISTLGNKFSVLSNIPNSIEGFSSKSFINGSLTRGINSNEFIYSFPVGSDTTAISYHRIDVINGLLEGTTSLTASVKSIEESGYNDDSRIVAGDNELTYTNIRENAIWSLTPNSTPTAGTYGVRLYTENIENLKDNEFAPLKRPDYSEDYAEWDYFFGTIISAANTPGRTVSGGYAERLGYTSFSEHAIAEGIPLIITGTQNGNQYNNLKLLPNPASDKLWISGLSHEVSIEILNSSGNIVFTNNTGTDSGKVEISIAELPSGFYVVKINSASGIFIEKFIKE